MSSYSDTDPVSNAIRQYENHPTVKKIRKTIIITLTFHFSELINLMLRNHLVNLNSPKKGTFKIIPTKCLKVTSDIWSLFLVPTWNEEHILNKKFPKQFKASRNKTSI